jgi:acetyl esterase/lipase
VERQRAIPSVLGALALLVALSAITVAPRSLDSSALRGAPRRAGLVPKPLEEGPGLIAEGTCATLAYTPPDAEPEAGELCLPTNPNGAALVLVHGGGGFGGDRISMDTWVDLYRDAGYATLAVEYTVYDEDSDGPVYPGPETDVKAAVQFLRQQAVDIGVDPGRIGLHGISAGARLGAQALVSAGDEWFESGGTWPGVPDDVNALVGFYGYYEGDVVYPDVYYGGERDSDDADVAERWEHADSTAQAAHASGPALLVHGQDDEVIPVEQTERFADALDEAGEDVTVEIVPDAGHAFDGGQDGEPLTEEGERIAELVLDWLADHL